MSIEDIRHVYCDSKYCCESIDGYNPHIENIEVFIEKDLVSKGWTTIEANEQGETKHFCPNCSKVITGLNKKYECCECNYRFNEPVVGVRDITTGLLLNGCPVCGCSNYDEIDKKLKELGFVERKNAQELGCYTMPCFGGKMPFEKGEATPCVIIRSMCKKSPYEMVLEETKDKCRT